MVKKEHKFINVFRAFAAFWVIVTHSIMWGWTGLPFTLPNPKLAVDLFMIISGYLMAANAFARQADEPLTNLRNQVRFWLRRFFRIAPAYYLSLFIAVVASTYFLEGYKVLADIKMIPSGSTYDPMRIEYTWQNILLHISFLFGLHPTWSFSTFLPDWSLSLEMQFYIVFPALLIFLKKRNLARNALTVGVFTFVMGAVIGKLLGYYEPSLIIMKLNYFIACILTFYIINSTSELRQIWGLIVCAFILVSLDIRYKWSLPVLPCILFLFLYAGRMENSLNTPKWLLSVFNSKIVHFSSNTSYGVYLFHGFFISASGLLLVSYKNELSLSASEWGLFTLIFVIFFSYLTAYIVFRMVELPGISFGRVFVNRFLAPKPKVMEPPTELGKA